jgi:hypothetical protein
MSKWLKEVNYMFKIVVWAGALAVISPLYLLYHFYITSIWPEPIILARAINNRTLLEV